MPETTAARLGLTIPLKGSPDSAPALARLADAGYTDFWTGETAGYDAFTPLAAAAGAVPGSWLGTAIASVFARGPALLAMSAAALAASAPGRFVLGIGASSPVLTRDWNAAAYERPLERVRDTARFLRTALAGEMVDQKFDTFTIRRFRLERPPQQVPPLLIGALRPGMLRVAAQEADGAVLNWLGAADVCTVRQVIGEGPLLAARVFVCCSDDAEVVRTAARRLIAGYLSVPGYAAYQRWLGRSAALTPMWEAWAAGDRRAAVAAVPDQVVDDLIVHGTAAECAAGLRAYHTAGVDIPIVKFLPFDPHGDLSAQAQAVARAYRAAA